MNGKRHQNSILRVSTYLFRYKGLFALTIGLAMAGTLSLMAIPNVIEWVFDDYLKQSISEEGENRQALISAIGILLFCFAMREFFNSMRIRANNNLEQKVVVDIRRDLHAKLLYLPVSYYDRNKSGELASRVVEDVDSVERALLDGTEQGTIAIFTVLGFSVMLFLKNPFLASFICFPIPILILMGIRHAKATRKNWREVRQAAGDLNSLLIEDIQGNRVIHSFALGRREKRRFQERALCLRERTLKAMYRWSLYGPSANFVNSLGMVSVVGVGGYLSVTDPQFSVGELSMFFFSTMFLYEPVSRLHQINHLLSTGKSSGDRVFEILDAPQEVEDPVNPKPFPGGPLEVRFQDICYRYPGRARVVESFNLTLGAGKTTALVGPTGAGKSTIANLLMRTYDVETGAVLINGIDIRAFEIETLRSNIGYVAQDPFLFEGTVRENILLADEQAAEQAIVHALESACALDFVRALPDGLDTNIGEKGIRLSQGEKQRLTIARVLLKNPRLVIFDEATASVDTHTEAEIQQALENLTRERTVLVIAHRLSTVRNAHQIVVLDQGSVCEKGSHDSLLQRNGFYASLWKRQAEHIPESTVGSN